MSYEDPIDGLLNGTEYVSQGSRHPSGETPTSQPSKAQDDDIQVISRDDYQDPFDYQFMGLGNTPNIPTPSNPVFSGENDDFADQDGHFHQPTGHTPLFPNTEDTTNNHPNHTNNHPVNNQNNQNNQNSIGDISNLPSSLADHTLFSANDLVQQPHNLLIQAPSKFQTPLPPLPPLSESVIPENFTMIPRFPDELKPPVNTNMNMGTITSKRRKEASTPKTRPAFVIKIWNMVNDPKNKDYIRWNDDGKTFQVFQREEFMKLILPKYFKHNNFASFVRQLNMYGWHKVQDITSGTMNQGKDEKGGEEMWKFENPNFIRDREDLLDKIVRNKSVNSNEGDVNEGNQVNFQMLLNELDQIKLHQLAIAEDIRRVRKDNKTLWQENYNTRERNSHQARTLDKILKFLAVMYGNNAGKFMELDNAGDFGTNNQMTAYNFNSEQSPPSPNTFAPGQKTAGVANGTPTPFSKPRLMLTNQAHRRSPPVKSNSHRGSVNTDTSTEEIIRSKGHTPDNESATNLNRMYQQLINQDSSVPMVASPRHFFPELNTGPGSPQFVRMTPSNSNAGVNSGGGDPQDVMSGLEQNIYKQGQSIQQVQEWIQKLATQQQQQQATINEINDDMKPPLDEFDVGEFLTNDGSRKRSAEDYWEPNKKQAS